MSRGRIRTVIGTNPAAGVEISETVPAAAIWQLIAMTFQLVASGTAANRAVRVVLDDGTSIFWQAGGNVTQTAGLTHDYSAGIGGAFGQTITQAPLGFLIALPAGVLLLPGYRVRTVTTNIQAGDDYGAPILYLQDVAT